MKNPDFLHFSTLAAVFLPSIASAFVIADDFSSGDRSGGTNWNSSSWTLGGNSSASVIDSSPLAPGGAGYLTVSGFFSSSGTGNTNRTHGVSRNFGTTVASNPYTVAFDWRAEGDLTTFTTFYDRFHIGASTGGINSDSTFSWLIGVAAANNGTTNIVPAGNWYFYDFDSTASNASTRPFTAPHLHDTGIAFEAGVTYSFVVTVDPSSKTYGVEMSSGGSVLASQTGLNFRTGSDTPTSTLVFGTVTQPDETRAFSIDNVTITGVPEPSSALLLGSCGLLGLLRRQRR